MEFLIFDSEGHSNIQTGQNNFKLIDTNGSISPKLAKTNQTDPLWLNLDLTGPNYTFLAKVEWSRDLISVLLKSVHEQYRRKDNAAVLHYKI